MIELPNRSTNHVMFIGNQLSKLMAKLPQGVSGFEMKIDPGGRKMILASRGLKKGFVKKVDIGRVPKETKRFLVGFFSLPQMVEMAQSFVAVAREAKETLGANIAIRFEPRKVIPRVVVPKAVTTSAAS